MNRLVSKSPGARTYQYTYLDVEGDKTTSLLSGLSVDGLVSYGYTYDAFGNIKTISENGTLKVTYTYDEWNQLVKEEHNGGDTIEYSYDGGGNLLAKKVNGTVVSTYTYGDAEWKDLLTGFNGQNITYDAIGNPLSYNNGEGYTFTWKNGRQLSTLQKGSTGVSYSYNADGLRTSKTVNGVKTEYAWDGSKLIAQKVGGKTLIFLYDATGLYGFRYEGNPYFYLYNGQGDVMGLVNTQGAQVVSYTYDAWGKPLATTGTLADTVGAVNPIRYRGYYYDAETGLYYVSSRYYDPVVGRFINADALLGANTGAATYNVFAYCGNNPVSYSDDTGTSPRHAARLKRNEKIKSKTGGSASVAAYLQGSMSGPILPSSPPHIEPTPKTTSEKILETFQSIGTSIDINAGIGIGLKAGMDITGVGLEAGVRTDLFTIKLENGSFYFGNEFDASLMGTFGPYEMGPHQYQFNDLISNKLYPEEFSWYKDNGAIQLFGSEAYFIMGAHYSIDFNYSNFLEKWDEIWN